MTVFNQEHLQQFRFRELFVNDLGWDLPAQQQPFSVEVADVVWVLQVVAHKRGVQVLHCLPGEDGRLPDYATRQNIERKITPDVREHLIVFTDAAQTTQIWQWVSRQSGKTAQYREVHFRKGETPELLAQKLSRLHFALDEEELLTVLGVTQRLDDAAPREKVTKKFYNEFEKQRKAFAAFIDGIPGDSEDQRWYTAVVIDRLMFLWFLQEKGFLDGQRNYLQLRLEAHLAAGLPQSFYKRFLSPLFFRGFAQERTPEIQAAIAAEFGNVPYLNGGLFAQHELEQQYGEALDIADAAFQKLFAFFDEWEWHLDERPLKSGKEINPDVLGYIFEKFVNQKQMGAYYTKEDITEYIGKNTIIPCLLSKVRAEHPGAFDALAWPLLQQSGDAYIYPAMLKGVDAPYPTEIANGLDTSAPDLLERRKPWNRRADDAVSLPTEIWRETIARHQRTRELRAKIAAGQLRDAGDLITWNLNIRQFAQDLIERCTDVALLKSFWFNLAGRLPRQSNEHFRHGLSVLDPTCGSGAFLFAALNILQPLYDATLRTLQAVRTDALITGETSRPEKWAEVDDILNRFNAAGSEHAQDYAVIKHIIVHNLYGVDIEKQATEIAKLRLFLKLVALLEPGDEIEPLPDIDFNIRHGNTLVGYATANETEQAVKGATQGNLFSDAWEDIRIRLTAVEQQYNNFQIQQVRHHGHVSAADKQALTETLHDLEEMLNYHLARDYGVNTTKTKDYEAWKASHQPFHWYVDFYPLMVAGGFDVAIGNPPYVQLSEIKDYGVSRYQCASCGNLYAVMLERAVALKQASGRTGFIVPVSAISTDGYSSLQNVYSKDSTHVSCFDDRPSRLFDGLEHIRLIVIFSQRAALPKMHTTRYYKWTAEERAYLFDKLAYFDAPASPIPNSIPKIGDNIESVLLSKIGSAGKPVALHTARGGDHFLNYSRKVGYFLQVLDFEPVVLSGDGSRRPPSEFKTIFFGTKTEARAALAILNSSLFYWYITLLSDCRHLNKREIESFPISSNLLSANASPLVDMAVRALMDGLDAQSEHRVMKFRHDQLTVQCLLPKKSWEEIQRIDELIADAFKFSAAEADYIANYDIKYRIGAEMEDSDD
ncbi:MAG: Eco57I restriction-modification methylase domain-containing protein [Curvibacter sp.]|jgi:hypothetical protein|nr:Eco57I restriction-modification methylase domain-containing protein [Curvibacter sp.]